MRSARTTPMKFQTKFHRRVNNLGIRHVCIKPASPKLNGRVVRSHLTTSSGPTSDDIDLGVSERFAMFSGHTEGRAARHPTRHLRERWPLEPLQRCREAYDSSQAPRASGVRGAPSLGLRGSARSRRVPGPGWLRANAPVDGHVASRLERVPRGVTLGHRKCQLRYTLGLAERTKRLEAR